MLRASVWPIALAENSVLLEEAIPGEAGKQPVWWHRLGYTWTRAVHRRLWCYTKGGGINKEKKGNLRKDREQNTKRQEGHGQLRETVPCGTLMNV